jgi:hypothetical protein
MPLRLTNLQRDAILRDYLAGEKICVIAARHGVHESYPGVLATRRGHRNRWGNIQRENMADATRSRYARRTHAENDG